MLQERVLLCGAGGSSSRGHAALCPVSCLWPGLGGVGGAQQGPPRWCKEQLAFCAFQNWELKVRKHSSPNPVWFASCLHETSAVSQKRKEKYGGEKNRYFALTQENIMHVFAGKNRVYIIFWSSIFSQSLPCYFCFSKEMHFFQCVLNVLCTLQVCYTLRTPNALPVL